MHATEIDRMWFRANPHREYRLRRQTPAEVQRWPVPPGPDFTAWCIIRRGDDMAELFAIRSGETWDDHDLELGLFFDNLREAA
jgi:hypothetical protein